MKLPRTITGLRVGSCVFAAASLVIANGCRTRETARVVYQPAPAPVAQDVYTPNAPVEAQGAAEAPVIQSSGTATWSGPTITDTGVLTSTDTNALVGHRVEFRNVRVQQVINRRVVVLSSDNGQNIYVVSERQVPVRAGERANITGTVEPTANSIADMALSPDSAQALSAAPVCVVAGYIEPANKLPPIGRREPRQE